MSVPTLFGAAPLMTMPSPPKWPMASPLIVTPEALTVSPLADAPALVPSRATRGTVPPLVASIVTGAVIVGRAEAGWITLLAGRLNEIVLGPPGARLARAERRVTVPAGGERVSAVLLTMKAASSFRDSSDSMRGRRASRRGRAC